MEQFAAGNTGGVQASSLEVHFQDGKVDVTLKDLSYGLLHLSSLHVVGSFWVQNGVPHFQAERIEPYNLATMALPSMIDQALAQYSAGWYVERIEVREGKIIVTAREAP